MIFSYSKLVNVASLSPVVPTRTTTESVMPFSGGEVREKYSHVVWAWSATYIRRSQ